MLRWYESIPVESGWAGDYEALDIGLPCCQATHPFADESANCGCGHHRALYGSAKRMLALDWNRADTQADLDRWRAFFFPRETIQAELTRRGIPEADIRQVLDELREQGLC